MTDPEREAITFISYVTPDESSKKAKELQLSKVRSHVARHTHSKRRTRNPGRCEEDKCSRQLALLRPNGIGSLSSVGDNGTPSSSNEPSNHRSPSKPMRQRHSGTTRPIDWFLGYDGGSCRPLSDIDVAAINWYIDHSLELSINCNLLARERQDLIKLRLAPQFQSIARRSVTELPLLNGLVAFVTFLLAEEHSANDALVAARQKCTCAAVQNVRSWISHANLTDTSVLSMVVCLCMATFGIGDLDAVAAHLRFLVAVSESLDLRRSESTRLLWEIRGCNLRFALQTGRPMITSAAHVADFEPTARKTIPCSNTFTHADIGTSASVPAHSYKKGNITTKVTLNAGNYGGELNSQIKRTNCILKLFHYGFFEALAAGILSPVMYTTIGEYTTVMDHIYNLAQDPEVPPFKLLHSMGRCYQCLEQMWNEWYQMHQWRSVVPSMDRYNDWSKSSTPQYILDEPVLLAIQIHLVLRSSLFLGPTLPVLAKRLLACLPEEQYLAPAGGKEDNGMTHAVFDGLLLWMLITGMMAAEKAPDAFSWYRKQAKERMEALGIKSEAGMTAALVPFVPASMPVDDRFLLVGKSLVIDAAGVRSNLSKATAAKKADSDPTTVRIAHDSNANQP